MPKQDNELNVGAVVTAVFVLAAVVLLGNAAVAYRTSRSLIETSGWVEHSLQVQRAQQALLKSLADAESEQRSYLLTANPLLAKTYEAAKSRALQRLEELQRITADNAAQRDRLAALRPQIEEWFRGLEQNLRLGTGRWRPELLEAGSNRIAAIENTLEHSQADEQGLLDERKAATEQSYRRAVWIFALATIAVLAAVGIGFYLIHRDVAVRRRLVREREAAAVSLEQLAADRAQAAAEHERLAAEQEWLAGYNTMLLESSGEGIYGIDRDGNCTFINRAAVRVLGVQQAEAIGKNMHALIHHVHPDGTPNSADDCLINRAMRDGIPIRVEDDVFVRADGSHVPVELSAAPLKRRGRVEGAVVVFADISARKRADADRAEQLLLSALAADVGEAVIQSDQLTGMLRRCAAALVQHLGAAFARIWTLNDAEQMLELQASAGMYTHLNGPHGRIPVGKFKIGLIAQERKPHLTNAVVGDEQVSDQQWARREKMVAFAGYPLVIGGRLVGVMAMFARHTLSPATLQAMSSIANSIALGISRKWTEEALLEAKTAADAANLAKSQFLANMSHELRTPLNAVILYSELLQEESEDKGVAEFVPDLEKIRAAGRHLLALVNGVLDLSKIEAGKTDLYLETFDVEGTIKDVACTAEALVHKNKNSLKVELDDSLGQVHADLTKVRQILFNLVSNAAKFTERGTVTMSAERGIVDGQEVITFRVLDTGIGLTAEQIGKLFRPFTQADESTTRKYGGTGLGLTISRRFAEIMGGALTVESEAGKGSAFSFRLPVRVMTEDAASSVDINGRPVDGAALVIDDDPAARALVVAALVETGVPAVAAGGGDDGLRLAQGFIPSIIFLDVIMPGMDGWAVLTALRADSRLTDVPVVMLTMAPGQELGYMLGAAEYVSKPIDQERLIAIIRKYAPTGADGGVLVVDDDPATREVVKRVLGRDGWMVVEAENGRVALEKMASGKFGLVILDLRMPEMDGFEFLAAVRKQESWRQTPVVVLTSQDLTPDQRALLSRQVEMVIQKGAYGREELLREVRAMAKRFAAKMPAAASAAAPALGTPSAAPNSS